LAGYMTCVNLIILIFFSWSGIVWEGPIPEIWVKYELTGENCHCWLVNWLFIHSLTLK
jgi:hypothetical protein